MKLSKSGRLNGSAWQFVNSLDLPAAFYKWSTTTDEPWGTKLYYLGTIFEKAGLYDAAIQSYQALVNLFPKTAVGSSGQIPWYPAKAAIAKIKFLIRRHPELGIRMVSGNVRIKNGFDKETANDIVIVDPVILERSGVGARPGSEELRAEEAPPLIAAGGEDGRVRVARSDSGQWQLLVNGRPFVVHGISYSPTKVGESPDAQTLQDWMTQDTNHDGRIDAPYEAWVDQNRNNRQDAGETAVGDFQLMKDMGVNTIRLYHQPFELNKELLRQLYQNYGIRVVVGDFLGKYTLGSGAPWAAGTDYDDPGQRQEMLASVRRMVLDYKDEPFVLMWLLGNENNYGGSDNADKKPESYYRFLNAAAQLVKSLDPNHPVAASNGDIVFIEDLARYAPDIDIFAPNLYRGDHGFGAFWDQAADALGKPVLVMEYGCPAYGPQFTLAQGEQAQAEYHMISWMDIEDNLAGHRQGRGNALGGVVFEWVDEWWKYQSGDPGIHDRKSGIEGPFPDIYIYEEWFGVCSQGNGLNSPFMRQLRPAYQFYQQRWSDGATQGAALY